MINQKRNKLKVYQSTLQRKGEVTGSCHYNNVIFSDGSSFSFLVDCGKQQMESEGYIPFKGFPFNPEKLGVVLLTHCHLDHFGRLPELYNLGCRCNVICTSGTAAILPTALLDSYGVDMMHCDIRYNKEDIQQLLSNILIIKYNEEIVVYKKNGNEIRVKALYNSHIPGSAMFLVTINDEVDGEEDFLFSGDFKVHSALCIEYPIPKEIFKKNINLQLESTYALSTKMEDPIFISILAEILGYENEAKKRADEDFEIYEEYDAVQTHKGNHEFKALIGKKSRGGARMKINSFIIRNNKITGNNKKSNYRIRNIIVPVISLERAQVVLYAIKCGQDKGLISKSIPIIMDAPLASLYNSIFLNDDRIELREECKKFLPANFHVERRVHLINSGSGVQIILVGGGMGHGPSKPYIAQALPRRDCVIFFTSYQAEGTLGRMVVEAMQGSKLLIDGEEVAKNAQVYATGEFSAHAHLLGLLEFISKFENLKSLIVVHGSDEARKTLIESANIIKKCPKVDFYVDVYLTFIKHDNGYIEVKVKPSKYSERGYNFAPVGTDNNAMKSEQKRKKREKKRAEIQKRTERKNPLTHVNMSKNNRVYMSSRNKAHKDSCNYRRH